MSQAFEINVDGACSGNPGPAGVGVVIRKDNKIIKEISQYIGEATNNIAEYTALIIALEEAKKLKASDLNIFTDSELMYKQIRGEYKLKNEKLKPLFDQVQKLAAGFKSIKLNHVLREKNKDADKLAVDAIKKHQQAHAVAPAFKNAGEESPSSTG